MLVNVISVSLIQSICLDGVSTYGMLACAYCDFVKGSGFMDAAPAGFACFMRLVLAAGLPVCPPGCPAGLTTCPGLLFCSHIEAGR